MEVTKAHMGKKSAKSGRERVKHYNEAVTIRVDGILLKRLNDCSRYEIQPLSSFLRQVLKKVTDEYGSNARFRNWIKIEDIKGWEEFKR